MLTAVEQGDFHTSAEKLLDLSTGIVSSATSKWPWIHPGNAPHCVGALVLWLRLVGRVKSPRFEMRAHFCSAAAEEGCAASDLTVHVANSPCVTAEVWSA